MDKIGFDNFRKFEHFPEISLSPVTYIVGPNNSGKSTFIKGLSLLQHNLNLNFPNFNTKIPFIQNVSFLEEGIENYGWGDYESNLNYESKTGIITFKWSVGKIDYLMEFGYKNCDKSESNINPPVQFLRIDLSKTAFPSILEYQRKEASKDWETNSMIEIEGLRNWISNLIFVIENILSDTAEEQINSSNETKPDFEEELIPVDALPFSMDLFMKLINGDGMIKFNENFFKNLGFYINLMNRSYENEEYNLLLLFSFIISLRGHNVADYLDPLYKALDRLNGEINSEVNSQSLKSYELNETIIDLYLQFSLMCGNLLNYSNIFSLSNEMVMINAHSASHDSVFLSTDKNNYLAQTIREFELIKDNTDGYNSARIWINKWLEEFNIGDNFIIKNEHNGTIYSVDIIKNNHAVPLGRNGTGIIQIFILLLRICIAKFKLTGNDETDIILIEEPEQNLHPSFQSKLTELFLDIVNTESLRLIIETHSEYMVRRTQVLVSEAGLSEVELEKENPFKVYYFPSEGIPYDMNYLSDGHFEEAFGAGFFDEAGKWTRELAKNRRK